MTTVIIIGLALVAMLAMLATVYMMARNAPYGYEDKTGFHFGKPTGKDANMNNKGEIVTVLCVALAAAFLAATGGLSGIAARYNKVQAVKAVQLSGGGAGVGVNVMTLGAALKQNGIKGVAVQGLGAIGDLAVVYGSYELGQALEDAIEDDAEKDSAGRVTVTASDGAVVIVQQTGGAPARAAGSADRPTTTTTTTTTETSEANQNTTETNTEGEPE